MISKEELRSNWEKFSGFDLRKLLEDNQNLSLPMLTTVGRGVAVCAFVYSCLPGGKVVVAQRHVWGEKGHQMMLCKSEYRADIADMRAIDQAEYLDLWCEAAPFLFSDTLSEQEKACCARYFALFERSASSGQIYLTENKPLALWAKKQELL